jgi:2-amino-4-hydroxy-6-hydroxymethyldihydropteridine diphosphokinase
MSTPFVTVYLSLGSNLGDRLENLARAVTLMRQAAITPQRTSAIYETEPVDYANQDWFLNCVAEIATPLPPLQLLKVLHTIETLLGRERSIPKGPRTIDIDILLYGNMLLSGGELTLPHPRMHRRRFVLEPLRTLSPELVIPGTGQSVEDWWRSLEDPARVRIHREILPEL